MSARATSSASTTAWGLAIVGAWVLKAQFGLFILGNCNSAAQWHYLCADIGPWSRFLGAASHGLVPYVDFTREYPVGIGTLFWGLGRLLHVRGFDATLRLQVGLSLACDLACALLLFVAARPRGVALAGLIAIVFCLLPASVVLSPLRYESVVGAVVLLGYLAYVRGHFLWAAALFSLGVTLKWYPIVALAIMELAALDRDYLRRRLPRVLAVCAGVQLAVNGPFLLTSWLRNGHIGFWLDTYAFHANRRLAPDTVLGVIALWFGEMPTEQYASLASGALALLVLCTRRRMPFEPKFVLVCVAALLVNRVYSPQFNLWFYPMLLLALTTQTLVARAWMLGLLLLIDLANVAVFPFLYAPVVDELNADFAWGGMAATGGFFSELFTAAVFLRAFALLALMGLLYKLFPAAADTGGSRDTQVALPLPAAPEAAP